MGKRIVFNGKGKIGFEKFDAGKPGEGKVLVKTTCSLMSTGTENIVLNRLFDPGTGWDNWVKYPFYPGYAAVGVVKELGKDVKTLKKGDRIVCRSGHASEHVVAADGCFSIPKGISDEEASWFALAKIAAMGARSANYKLGETLVVVGAGPIGQMTVRWAAAAGVGKIICVDPFAMRLKHALKGGADFVIAKGITEAIPEISKLTDGNMADIVIDSTGHHMVFPECFKAAKKYGRIVILGDTGSPSKQCLSHDVMNKGLTIVAAHDCHETPDWDSKKIISLLFNLALKGRFSLKGMITHKFKAEEYQKAYDTANTKRNETIGILFKW
ncbi:MAG: zinc-binding alcohol dehydrogenase [Victivallales bacterium]